MEVKERMCKIVADVSQNDMLLVGTELSKHPKINGIAFKFDSREKKLIRK